MRGVNWLGDAVMSTPALMRLRWAFPQAHIALLTPEKLRDLWRQHPAVTEAIAFEPGASVFSIARGLRERRFDTALILPNSPRSALESWLARIPRRIGYARPWRNWLLTTRVPSRPGAVKMRKRSADEIKTLVAGSGRPSARDETFPPESHHLFEYLHLAGALGANTELTAPQLFVTAGEIEGVRKQFDLGALPGPVLGLNAGAEYGPAKRWPVERFAAAAREIQRRTGCPCFIFGGQGDAPIANQVEAALRGEARRVWNLAGRTSLRELMCLLKLCSAVITNDSGPMHVAAALGTPVIALYGSTSPELTGPGTPGDPRHHVIRNKVPCAPCFLRECPIDFRCMTGIGTDHVVEAAMLVLGGVRG